MSLRVLAVLTRHGGLYGTAQAAFASANSGRARCLSTIALPRENFFLAGLATADPARRRRARPKRVFASAVI